jgi:hypothetical protein
MRRLARIVVLAFGVVSFPSLTEAALIDLGTLTAPGATIEDFFQDDNDVATLGFAVGLAGAAFSAHTTSYSTGGFDTYMVLLNTASWSIVEYVDPDDQGLYPAKSQDISGTEWDDTLALTLSAGNYLLLLMQYDNDFAGVVEQEGMPPLLAFLQTTPDFTSIYTSDLTGDCTRFLDFNGSCRQNSFTLNATLTPADQPAPVPEPATLTLFGIGAAGAMLRKTMRRRRTPSSH